MNLKDVDVDFDFTTDTKGFWERNDGLGAGGADPDSKSKTLRLQRNKRTVPLLYTIFYKRIKEKYS